jgi:hypothetical protein
MTKSLGRWWNGYFFAPDSAENIAACRILFYGGMLALHWNVDFAAWGDVSDIFWMPVRSFEMLGVPKLGPGLIGWMSVAWKASLALCCVGLLTRVSSAVAVVLGAYLLGLLHSMGDLSHGDAAAVLILGVLALARSGDALSLDALVRGERPPPSGEYRWPVRAAWLVMSTVFFAAGIAKLVQGGPAWAFSENMAFILAEHQFPPEHPEAMLSWGAWMARHPWLYQSLGLATLVLEVGYPLAMFSWRARLALVPGMLMAVLGFRVLMGPSFIPLMLCHVFWVRWRRAPVAEPTSAKHDLPARSPYSFS